MERNNINIRKIAKIAGVSASSISRALQGSPSRKLSVETRKRILEICDKFQYYPNTHTVRMFSRRANTIAFVFPTCIDEDNDLALSMMDPNLGACIKGAQDVFSSHSMYLMLTATTDKFLQEKEYLKIFRSKMIDGMLIWGWIENDMYLYELMDEKVPLVMVQTESINANVDKVVADDYNGMKAIVENVLSKGHKKIAVIFPSLAGSAGMMRYKGIMDTFEKNNIKPQYITKTQAFAPELGYKAGLEIFDKASDATCIIAPNDLAAYGVLNAAKGKNIKIPDDVSLTGADGLKQYGYKQLTTYISPSYQIGAKGAELLISKIESKNLLPQRICLPTALIEGETVQNI